MNPLSPLIYYRRHKWQTLLLLVLISLMTLGISVMVRLPDSFLEHMYDSTEITLELMGQSWPKGGRKAQPSS